MTGQWCPHCETDTTRIANVYLTACTDAACCANGHTVHANTTELCCKTCAMPFTITDYPKAETNG